MFNKENGQPLTSLDFVTDAKLWDGLQRFAAARVNSRMLPLGVKDVDGVISVVLYGLDLGFSMGNALDNLQVIQNKISPPAQAMWAMVVFRLKATPEIVVSTDQQATVALSAEGRTRMEFTYTIEMARQAKLSGDNWTKYPSMMLLARAKSVLCRNFAPDVVGGMYSQEELSAGPSELLPDDLTSRPEAGSVPEMKVAEAKSRRAPAAAKPKPAAAPAAAAPAPAPAAPSAAEQEPEQPPVPEEVTAAAEGVLAAKAEQAERGAQVAAAIADGLGGREVKAAFKEPLVGRHVSAVMEGDQIAKGATANAILDAVAQAIGDRPQATALLKKRVGELGAAKSADLDHLGFEALLRWADALIDDEKRKKVEQAVAPFNPARGAGTKGPTAPVEDGEAVDLDESIAVVWGTLAERGLGEQAGKLLDDSGYSETLADSTNAVKEQAFNDLKDLLKQAV